MTLDVFRNDAGFKELQEIVSTPCFRANSREIEVVINNKPVELRESSPLLQHMLKTVEGVYQNGQVELTELPKDVNDHAQVLVTFLEPGKVDPTKLRQLIDQLETIAGIQQGFEELNAGQTRSIRDFVQEMQQKHGISG